MKQGVLSNSRVKLLLKKGHSCFRPRRKGDRRRRSVRGCIVDSNLSVLNLVIVKKGEKDIPGEERERERKKERERALRVFFGTILPVQYALVIVNFVIKKTRKNVTSFFLLQV